MGHLKGCETCLREGHRPHTWPVAAACPEFVQKQYAQVSKKKQLSRASLNAYARDRWPRIKQERNARRRELWAQQHWTTREERIRKIKRREGRLRRERGVLGDNRADAGDA